jgi:hypothetical protein
MLFRRPFFRRFGVAQPQVGAVPTTVTSISYWPGISTAGLSVRFLRFSMGGMDE